jgi:hypothetical protein
MGGCGVNIQNDPGNREGAHMSEFQLGQRVRFTHPMVRRSIRTRTIKSEESFAGGSYTRTLSINKEWQGNQFAQPAEGIIVGKRKLSNGYVQWEEWGNQYSPAEYFTAWIVVKDLRSAPVQVLPEHITAIP